MTIEIDDNNDSFENEGLYRHYRTYNSSDVSLASGAFPVNNVSRGNSGDASGKEYIASLCIAYVVLLHIQLQYTLYISSLWPFLLELDPDATESFYGCIVAIFHIAGAAASPLFGKLSNRMGTKALVILGLILTAVGSSMHLFAHLFPIRQRKWAVLAGRGFAGISVGARASIFAYSMEAFPVHKRGYIIASRTIVLTLSRVIGPLVQAASVPLGLSWNIISVNMYTVPDLIIFATVAGCVSLMVLFFRDLSPRQSSRQKPKGCLNQSIDKRALWTSLLMRTIQVINVSTINSLSSPITMSMLGWSNGQTVWFNGIIYAVLGLLTAPINFSIAVICLKYVKERALMVVSTIVLILGFLVAFPWPWYPSIMSTFHTVGVNQTSEIKFLNVSHLNSSMDFGNRDDNHQYFTLNDIQTCGYSWCDKMPIMTIGGYITLIFSAFLSIGVGLVPAANLFSNMLGPVQQGAWQGFLVSSEMLGMGIGPIIGSIIFEYFGTQVLFLFGMATACLSILPLIPMYKRMLSWYEIVENEDTASKKQKRFG